MGFINNIFKPEDGEEYVEEYDAKETNKNKKGQSILEYRF